MLRRFVLVGLMVLYQDTMMQLVVGTLLAAAFLLFQVQASPYINMSDDLLASSLGPRFRAWLRSPATNRAAAMPPCASNVRVGRPLSVLRRAGACHRRDPPRRPRAVRRRKPRPKHWRAVFAATTA